MFNGSSHSNMLKQNILIIIILLSGAFISVLNQTVLSTAIPVIMTDLKLTESTAQSLQSIFMLVNGIMIPITAFLIERFTARRLFFVAMSLFIFGTFIAATANVFFSLFLGRIFQAAGAGVMMPLIQTVIFIIFPANRRGTAMGLYGLVASFAPTIGPTLAGWIIDTYHWRFIFYLILPIAIMNIIFAFFYLRNLTERSYVKVDIISVILSTFGFGGLLYGFSIAGDFGWGSQQFISSFVIGVISLVLFIRRQLKLEKPMLEFRVFTYRTFSISICLAIIVFVTMVSATLILPLYMQNMLGMPAFYSGLVLLPGAIVLGVMSPISGRLFDLFGARGLAITGFFLLTVTSFMLTKLTAETSMVVLSVINVVRMLAIALITMPITTAGLNALPLKLLTHGLAMNNTLRQVGGAVGTALLITIMAISARQTLGVTGLIKGVNVTFMLTGLLSLIGFILAFFVHSSEKQ